MSDLKDKVGTFFSGGPGTTGREVFEDPVAQPGTATGVGGQGGQGPFHGSLGMRSGNTDGTIDRDDSVTSQGAGTGIPNTYQTTSQGQGAGALAGDNQSGQGYSSGAGGNTYTGASAQQGVGSGVGNDIDRSTGVTGLAGDTQTGTAGGNTGNVDFKTFLDQGGDESRLGGGPGVKDGTEGITAGLAGTGLAGSGVHPTREGYDTKGLTTGDNVATGGQSNIGAAPGTGVGTGLDGVGSTGNTSNTTGANTAYDSTDTSTGKRLAEGAAVGGAAGLGAGAVERDYQDRHNTSGGLGQAGTVGNTPSGQYGSVANVGEQGHHKEHYRTEGLAQEGQERHHHHHHHHHDQATTTGNENKARTDTAAVGAATGAAGATSAEDSLYTKHAAGNAATTRNTAESGNTSFPSSDTSNPLGRDFQGLDTSNTGRGDAYNTSDYAPNRVGAQNQGGALYERTGDQGPVTTGAAGTDRFDSDRVRTGQTGQTGQTGVGAQEGYTGSGGTAGGATGYGGADQQEVTERAQGKSSGGIAGILGTSDKDFTGRDRLGTGAYADDQGTFQGNTSGPGGNSALTGREGNVSNNPVARAKSGESGDVAGNGQGSPTKKSFMTKVKDALK